VPIPHLGDKTLRAVVKTKAGKLKAADWLKAAENQTAGIERAQNISPAYDFAWMWKELGIADLRK
jgi:hypothetical protein